MQGKVTRKRYEVTVHSAGYIRGQGFDVREIDEPRWQRDLRSTVFVLEGDRVKIACASCEVPNPIIETQFYDGPSVTFGRFRFFAITDRLISEAIDHNA